MPVTSPRIIAETALATLLILSVPTGCSRRAGPAPRSEPAAPLEGSLPEAAPPPPPSPSCEDQVTRMSELVRGLHAPPRVTRPQSDATGEPFDVHRYFDVLTHLSPEEGVVLHHVYVFRETAGFPQLYGRPAGQPPFRTEAEYVEDRGEVTEESYFGFTDHIVVDGTAQGFVELVVLRIMGPRFYEHWHGGYSEGSVVCSQDAVERTLAFLASEDFDSPMDDEQAVAARAMDVTPEVVMEGNSVRVSLVVFSSSGGFRREIYTIRRDFPHRFLAREQQALVEYESGFTP